MKQAGLFYLQPTESRVGEKSDTQEGGETFREYTISRFQDLPKTTFLFERR
jgi:hypothetical protein